MWSIYYIVDDGNFMGADTIVRLHETFLPIVIKQNLSLDTENF